MKLRALCVFAILGASAATAPLAANGAADVGALVNGSWNDLNAGDYVASLGKGLAAIKSTAPIAAPLGTPRDVQLLGLLVVGADYEHLRKSDLAFDAFRNAIRIDRLYGKHDGIDAAVDISRGNCRVGLRELHNGVLYEQSLFVAAPEFSSQIAEEKWSSLAANGSVPQALRPANLQGFDRCRFVFRRHRHR